VKRTLLLLLCCFSLCFHSCSKDEDLSPQSYFLLGDEKLTIKDYYASLDYGSKSDSGLVFLYHFRFYTGDRYPLIDSQDELYQERGSGWQIELRFFSDAYPIPGSGLYPDPSIPRSFRATTNHSVSGLSAYYYEGSKIDETRYWHLDSCQLELKLEGDEIEILSDHIAMSRYGSGSQKAHINSELHLKERLKSIFIER